MTHLDYPEIRRPAPPHAQLLTAIRPEQLARVADRGCTAADRPPVGCAATPQEVT